MAESSTVSPPVPEAGSDTSQSHPRLGGKTVGYAYYAPANEEKGDSDVDAVLSTISSGPVAGSDTLLARTVAGKTVDFASYVVPEGGMGNDGGDIDEGSSIIPPEPAVVGSDASRTHPSVGGKTVDFASYSVPGDGRGDDEGDGVKDEDENEDDDEDAEEEEDDHDEDEDDHDEDDDDEEDEDEQMDEDGCSVVEDIRGDLEEALHNVDFQGSFYFARTYDDVPNPVLRLADLGTIGLPLGIRDAAAIIEKCEQAPFGKGERTVVNKEVRDTWQMDASKVSFDNPTWAGFLDRVVQEVCQGLGVNREASQPRCDLHKLLLYEAGSHFLAHVDTEKADNMFATIVVVLPTLFTGGDAHLMHGGLSVILNSSAFSLSKTTVLAWYTDVKHEIKHITSGYRLALSFNLIHTTTALRPSISDDAAPLLRLRHVLRTWKDEQDGLDRIIYKLDHTYSHANLSASALKGPDAHVLAIIDEAAKELGFCLALGTLQHTIQGYAEDDFGGYYSRHNVHMGEICRQSTSIDTLFDLDGHVIAKNVRLEEESATIPHNFLKAFERQKWDDEDYEGYQGNEAGEVSRFYRRTVLIIWPTGGGPCRGGDRRAAYALDRLSLCTSTSPTPEERELFALLQQSNQTDKLPMLCRLAQQWRRGDLWQEVILTLGGETKPAQERFAPVAACGLEPARKSIETFIRQSRSNSKRFEMLTTLESWAKEQLPSPLQQDVANFVREETTWLLLNLCAPTQQEKRFITDAAILHGGVLFLETAIIPQIKAQTKASYCLTYTGFLRDNAGRLAPNTEDAHILGRIINDLLKYVVEKTNFFKSSAHSANAYSRYGHTTKAETAPEKAFKVIKRCLDYDQPALAARAIERMIDTKGLTFTESASRAFSVLLPLSPLLDDDLKTRTPRPELPLAQLSEAASRLVFESEFAQNGRLSTSDIDALLSASLLGGNTKSFTSLFTPKLKALPWNENNWKAYISLLHKRRNEPAFASVCAQLDELVTTMATVYAHKANLPTSSATASLNSAPSRRGAHFGARGRPTVQDSQICDVLSVCAKAQGRGSMKIVLDRVLQLGLLHSTRYFSNILIPLIEQLATFSKQHGLALSEEPFASTIQRIMRLWQDNVLGAMPDSSRARPFLDTLARYNCICDECKRVRNFLTASPQRELMLTHIGVYKRKHVEQELSKWARGAATYEFIKTTPQGLKVTKAEVMLAPAQWQSTQIIGLRALKALGHEPELRAIFGDQYTMVIGRLNGIPVADIPPARSHDAATAAGGTVSQHAVASSSSQPEQRPPTAPPAHPRVVNRIGNASSSVHSTRPGPAAPVTPAKRKASDSDVIDLCTP